MYTNSIKNQTETTISAVTFENVSLQIGTLKILNTISLSILEQEIVGILGPNGAGKTTLLSLITGLGRQTSGEITVLGHSMPSKESSLRQQIGVVLQETNLYEELTVAENLLFFASLYHVSEPKHRTKDVLALLGLTERANDPVHILSGGLKRRTAIARALLHNPKLLVVDEPTLGVDVETRHAIWEHLKLLRSQGHTILLASNYLDEAQAICDTVSILHNGKLIISDSPQALIARTGHSLDIECTPESAQKITHALANNNGVVRTEKAASGISVYLRGEMIPDTIVSTVVKAAPINGFRFRPADLAEVFQTLEIANSLTKNESTSKPQLSSKNLFAKHAVLFTILAILILGALLFMEVWLSQPK